MMVLSLRLEHKKNKFEKMSFFHFSKINGSGGSVKRKIKKKSGQMAECYLKNTHFCLFVLMLYVPVNNW